MTGTRQRMPRLLTRLTAWLVLGLAPGWVSPGAAFAAGDEDAGDNSIPPFTASAMSGETGDTPAVQIARAPLITPTTTEEDIQSTSGLEITPNPDDGPEVKYFQITGITGGTLYLNDGSTPIENGQFITAAQAGAGLKFTPAPDANSPAGDKFTFTARGALDASGTGLGEGTSADITVYEVNDLPTGGADTLKEVTRGSGPLTISFNTLITNDSPGPDNERGQSLTIISVGGAVGGSVRTEGTDVVFTLDPDFWGTASFTYTISDNGTTNGAPDPRLSGPITVTIPVTKVADVPQITATTTYEDTQSTDGLVITRSAVDGDEVAHFKITGITGGTLYLNDGETPIADGQFITADQAGAGLKFTPAPDANSTLAGDLFTFTVQAALDGEGKGLSEGVNVQIRVIHLNDPPVGVADILDEVLEDSEPVRIPFGTLTGNDLPGPPDEQEELWITSVGQAVGGTVRIEGTDVVFTLEPDFNGTAGFTYELEDRGTSYDPPAADPKRSVVPTMVTIPVTPVNDAPIAEDQSLTATAGKTLSGTVKAADVDGDSLIYEVVDPPTLGTVSMNPDGSFAYYSSRSGQDRFTFKAYDGTDDSNVATVMVQVNRKPGGSSRRPAKPAEPIEPATPEPPTGDGETTEGDTEENAPPVSQDVEAGQPAEAKMLNFEVSLPGGAITEPVRLRVLSPTANTDAVQLAEGAAEVADSGDVELIRPEDGSTVSEVAATITFAYDPQVISDPTALRIFYFDTKQNVWVEIGGVVDTEAHTITVQVGHFTTFAALVARAGAPVLPELPAEVRSEKLTVSGTAGAGTPVTLVINGDPQATVMTDENGRYTLEGTLAEGQNWVYVKGAGALASREWSVTYQSAEEYTDISGHWAEGMISQLAELGVVNVYPAPLFEPEAKVTRLEFAVMVARVLGLAPADEAPVFTDTALMPEWAWPEVAAAYQAGIIKGMLDGSFAPDRLVSRAEMAVMLIRALEYAGKDVTPGDHRFADVAEIPDWAKDQVHAAARWGLITGYTDGSFQPAKDTTRAEAVTMLGRLLDKVSE